jgi:hypothetical protein
MTPGAETNQVIFYFLSRVAAVLHVMYLKVGHGATGLTPPAISLENLFAELLVRHGV